MNNNEKARENVAASGRADNAENDINEGLRDDFNTRGWIVSSVLPSGRQNALSPEALCSALGFKSKRALRREVERERRNGALICSSLESGGYYLPGSLDELRRFVHTQQARIKTTEDCIASARRALEEVENGKD